MKPSAPSSAAPIRPIRSIHDCAAVSTVFGMSDLADALRKSARLAKISINCCLVASIAVANTLAELCERIGADWSEIAPALKLDRRIGPDAYLAPGLGIAGGNLEPRNLATVPAFGGHPGTEAGVVAAWLRNSRYRRDWPLRQLREKVLGGADPVIGILGVTYKENTHSIKNSPAVALIKALTGCR